jgi:hypothetical protein
MAGDPVAEYREVAERIAKDIHWQDCTWNSYGVVVDVESVADRITTALAAARKAGEERAAALVERYRHRCDEADEIATAIRALPDTET